MKKYLLPETGKFYKANLNCHSTVSDGRWTPEEIKKNYMEKGYSVVAYTDNNIFVTHNDLADEGFLPLNGAEIFANRDAELTKFSKTCHFSVIALSPDKTEIPGFKPKYNPECISNMMKEASKSGFFVIYNHPSWSMESYNDYISYFNMHAMEIYNHSTYCLGHDEHNAKEYAEMLKSGKRLYCVATDGNCSKAEDFFGGFTMIKADSLNYEAITRALMDGNFYSSEGPVIEELWFEDNKVHIRCQPAVEIFMKTQYRFEKVKRAYHFPVTEATFEINGREGYVRFVVVDKNGKMAYTNAYFLEDLLGGSK